MSLRFFSTGLLLLMLALASGCHNNQSRYGAAYGQPALVTASPGCNPCNNCGAAPPPGVITPPLPH